jgi:CheY-like chemotaxis protein
MPTVLSHSKVLRAMRSHASAVEQITATEPIRILFVDDDASVLRSLGPVLRNAGYHPVLATNGPAALQIAKTGGSFDLLVTDLHMPRMTGEELARRIREVQSSIKVLYLTAYSDQLFDERITLQEDEAYLDKPCSVAILLEAISQLLWGHTRPEAVSPAECGSQNRRGGESVS